LDLVFEDSEVQATQLPEVQYLPALERQRQLEKQLADQQVVAFIYP